MVLIRKSTLLCRQLVRRSMVFSTVQISMPGTSWAAAVAESRAQMAGNNVAANTGRLIISFNLRFYQAAKQGFQPSVNGRTRQPQRHTATLFEAEICGGRFDLARQTAATAGTAGT